MFEKLFKRPPPAVPPEVQVPDYFSSQIGKYSHPTVVGLFRCADSVLHATLEREDCPYEVRLAIMQAYSAKDGYQARVINALAAPLSLITAQLFFRFAGGGLGATDEDLLRKAGIFAFLSHAAAFIEADATAEGEIDAVTVFEQEIKVIGSVIGVANTPEQVRRIIESGVDYYRRYIALDAAVRAETDEYTQTLARRIVISYNGGTIDREKILQHGCDVFVKFMKQLQAT